MPHTEPTAPIKLLTIDLGEYPGIDRSPTATTEFPTDTPPDMPARSIRMHVWVAVEEIPSEHWTYRRSVKWKPDSDPPRRRPKELYDLSTPHQNAGSHHLKGSRRQMKIDQANEYELRRLVESDGPGVLTVDVKVTGDHSGVVLEESCSVHVVAPETSP